jgi:hypothetical protein
MTYAKKDVLFPGVRMSSELAEQVRAALNTLGVDTPSLRRQLVADLIRIAETGEQSLYRLAF